MDLSATPQPPGAASSTRVRQAKQELLSKISDFVMKHDLSVTGSNLAAIAIALSGSNAALAEAFVKREISGEAIDQEWLNAVARIDPAAGERMNELEKLMDRIEYSLMRFAQTAKNAADETTEQRGVLDAQVQKMESRDKSLSPEAEVDRVISLSKVMLERMGQVETAMERSQAESDRLRANLAKARIEADVDHLTRLPNRRAFERRFAAAAKEAQMSGKPLCVAFCDVDKFKSINDTHGHDTGDRVLVAIANKLSQNAGDECFVARHGGEEFVVLFYGLDEQAAWRRLDGIRRAQSRKQMINRETGKPFGKITFSGGIATVQGVDDMRAALSRADEALYKAKEEGRNRIISA